MNYIIPINVHCKKKSSILFLFHCIHFSFDKVKTIVSFRLSQVSLIVKKNSVLDLEYQAKITRISMNKKPLSMLKLNGSLVT